MTLFKDIDSVRGRLFVIASNLYNPSKLSSFLMHCSFTVKFRNEIEGVKYKEEKILEMVGLVEKNPDIFCRVEQVLKINILNCF